MKIAINGAGIAGTTLAHWLLKFGHEPVLIEQAPRLRVGGYVIDFWGVGFDVAERMGLIPDLRDVGYAVEEWRIVGNSGRKRGGFSTTVFNRLTNGRFISLQRSDLAAAIYATIEGKVETIFGDSLTGIEDKPDRATVTFEHHPPRDFDLVIGADGLHSRVRELTFGPERQFEAYLGYCVAAFQVEGYEPRDELVYISHTRPGQQISRFSMRDNRTLFLFVFRDDTPESRPSATDQDRKSLLRDVFRDASWEVSKILTAMDKASDIYFDRVSQIRMKRWTQGRVTLIGDSAGCVSLLAGEGAGIAMAEAYVLACESANTSGTYENAFANYEKRMMPFVQSKQEAARNFAAFFAPETKARIALRDIATWLMNIPVLAEIFIGRDLRDNIQLPEYESSNCHQNAINH